MQIKRKTVNVSKEQSRTTINNQQHISILTLNCKPEYVIEKHLYTKSE